ncbi:MAG: D-aminoacyl-tRNA deacylase [bacterium]
MRCVIQRVSSASVRLQPGHAKNAPIRQQQPDFESRIGAGMLCLIGIESDDTSKDLEYIAKKIMGLRLWPDDAGKPWNHNVAQANGSILCVSQFTLSARTRKGTRPDFSRAMAPDQAKSMYEEFIATLRGRAAQSGVVVQDGVFAAMMDVELINDGPVTILLDSASD